MLHHTAILEKEPGESFLEVRKAGGQHTELALCFSFCFMAKVNLEAKGWKNTRAFPGSTSKSALEVMD